MKECSRGGGKKPDEEFYFNRKNDSYFSYCKPCASTNQRDKAKRRRTLLSNYKKRCGCAHCGFNQSGFALDFHHKDDETKTSNPSHLVAKSSLKRLFSELRKCVVLCANCHRMVHSGELILPSEKTDEHLV